MGTVLLMERSPRHLQCHFHWTPKPGPSMKKVTGFCLVVKQSQPRQHIAVPRWDPCMTPNTLPSCWRFTALLTRPHGRRRRRTPPSGLARAAGLHCAVASESCCWSQRAQHTGLNRSSQSWGSAHLPTLNRKPGAWRPLGPLQEDQGSSLLHTNKSRPCTVRLHGRWATGQE